MTQSSSESLPQICASTWGPPTDGSTYSGIPKTIFSRLERRGNLAGKFNQKPSHFKSLVWGRLRLGIRDGVWPEGFQVWRYLPKNIDRLSVEFNRSGQWEDADVVFQFGVAGMPKPGLPLLAHIEYPIGSVFETEMYAKNHRFSGLSDAVRAQAVEGERIFTDRCDLIWTNTPYTSGLLQKSGVGQEKIRVLTPPGNFPELKSGERDWSRKKILFVGRNWEVKGGDHLVRAFEILRKTERDASLIIIGCDPPESVGELDGVECLGYLSMDAPSERSRLLEEYRTSTVFCMPSNWESTGMVFMEAASAGLPVIMRRIPETDALYPDDLFKKVEDESPEALAEILLQDLQGGAAVIERAEEAARFVKENFGLDVFLHKIDDLLREVSTRGRG